MINRRDFVGGMAAAGVGGALGGRAGRAEAEPPPETSTIRVSGSVAICTAPQLVSEDLLRAEGFSVVQDKTERLGPLGEVAAGTVDIGITFIGPTIIQIDGGQPVTVLAGVHPGCFELFGTDRVRSLRDLKGKKIAVISIGSSPHVFLSSMLAHVGLDPRKDVEWVVKPRAESVQSRKFRPLQAPPGLVDGWLRPPPEQSACPPAADRGTPRSTRR